ncbi:hypothetical protein [Pseudomonas sp. NFACC04-2]
MGINLLNVLVRKGVSPAGTLLRA